MEIVALGRLSLSLTQPLSILSDELQRVTWSVRLPTPSLRIDFDRTTPSRTVQIRLSALLLEPVNHFLL